MTMPQVHEAHRKLERLVGNWVGKERIFPSPIDPEGGPASARVHNQAALNGFIVVQNYDQQREGKTTFSGHGVFWYDAAADQYCMTWWDSMGMSPAVYRGKFDGNILSLQCSEPRMMSRATFDLTASDRYTFKMEVSMDGSQWFPFIEGEYQKSRNENLNR